MERNINSSINPIRNRELPHALLHHLVSLVDWPVAEEIRLLCTAEVLSNPGCTDSVAIIPLCQSPLRDDWIFLDLLCNWLVVWFDLIWTSRGRSYAQHPSCFAVPAGITDTRARYQGWIPWPRLWSRPACPALQPCSRVNVPAGILIGSLSPLHSQLANKQFAALLHFFDWSSTVLDKLSLTLLRWEIQLLQRINWFWRITHFLFV